MQNTTAVPSCLKGQNVLPQFMHVVFDSN